MPASQHEQLQSRVRAALLAADTAAEDRVERGRLEAPAAADTPALNIVRRPGAFEPFGSGADAAGYEFGIEHWTSGDNWETAADELHMQVHAALVADPVLSTLVRSLRCVATDTQGHGGEVPVGRLTATYRAQTIASPTNLATRNPY